MHAARGRSCRVADGAGDEGKKRCGALRMFLIKCELVPPPQKIQSNSVSDSRK